MSLSDTGANSTQLNRKELLLLLVLAVIQFAHIVDFMIIMPLGAQFMDLFDISPQQFSLIVSVYAGAAFVMGLFSALFIDRFDRKQALFLLFIGFTVGTLACYFADSYLIFLIARTFTGAFGGILSALVFSIVADTIPLVRRGRAMGIVMMAFSAASVVGVPLGIYLAAAFSTRFPFLVVGLVSVLCCFLIFFAVPPMRTHLRTKKSAGKVFQAFLDIASDRNQLLALFFNLILILGHFTIIPFIAPYMELNVGLSAFEITYIYLVGGLLTAVLLPLVGRLSDRYGHARIFTIASIAALGSIFWVTNLQAVSLVFALFATSSFFVVASGRNVPALTMVTSVVKPENRGSFMSVRSSIQEAGLALAALISGLIVVEGADGQLLNYNYAGYIAIIMSILAVLLAWRLKVIDN